MADISLEITAIGQGIVNVFAYVKPFGPFTFAWADADETVFGPEHHRVDENIFDMKMEHAEGDFATLSIVVRNLQAPLLAPGRPLWAWIGWNSGPDIVPLFFGRLVGMPQDTREELYQLDFIARPRDFVEQKTALAEALKVKPYWDEIFIDPDRRADPDVVLESRPQLWHIDRITHQVTASHVLLGEDGTENFDGSNIFYDSFKLGFGDPPLRAVEMTAEMGWTQTAYGGSDLTYFILRQWPRDDSEYERANQSVQGYNKLPPLDYMILTFSGEGFSNDWPKVGANIGGGWSAHDTWCEPAVASSIELKPPEGLTWINGYPYVPGDGPWGLVPFNGDVVSEDTILVPPGSIVYDGRLNPNEDPLRLVQASLWYFIPRMHLRYDVERARKEIVKFTIKADAQALVSDPGDEDKLMLSMSSVDLGDPTKTSDPPIPDLRARSFIPTPRGLEALDYLVAVACSHLIIKSRAVEIEFETPFENVVSLSCRKNAYVEDHRIPGGKAVGKIKAYGFRISGEDGSLVGYVRLGVSVGYGTQFDLVPGYPTYVREGYVDQGYQRYEGGQRGVDNIVAYDIPADNPNDDGVEFRRLFSPTEVVKSFSVQNPSFYQRQMVEAAVAAYGFPDSSFLNEELRKYPTTLTMELLPLTGGPFETVYEIKTNKLILPLGIDLEDIRENLIVEMVGQGLNEAGVRVIPRKDFALKVMAIGEAYVSPITTEVKRPVLIGSAPVGEGRVNVTVTVLVTHYLMVDAQGEGEVAVNLRIGEIGNDIDLEADLSAGVVMASGLSADSTQILVIAGNNRSFYTSMDGTTWTERGLPALSGNTIKDVCWSPEQRQYVAISQGGTTSPVYVSPDGISWTEYPAAANRDWQAICWSADLAMYVAVASSDSLTDLVMYSHDGKTWQSVTVPAARYQDIDWSPELGMFVAVSLLGSPDIIKSFDGINWTTQAIGGGRSRVHWSPSAKAWFIHGGSSPGYRSFDGVTWSGTMTFSASNPSGFASTDGGLVAFNLTGSTYYTLNRGQSWSTDSQTSIGAHNWMNAGWSRNLQTLFATGGLGQYRYSTDGITWTYATISVAGSASLTGVASALVVPPPAPAFRMVGKSKLVVGDITDAPVPAGTIPVWLTGDQRARISVTLSRADIFKLYKTEAYPNPNFLVDGFKDDLRHWNYSLSDLWIKFDFGVAVGVNGFRWYQTYPKITVLPAGAGGFGPMPGWNGHYAGKWQWYGSDDDATFVPVGTPFDLRATYDGAYTVLMDSSGLDARYRYWRLTQVSGHTPHNIWWLFGEAGWVQEIEFLAVLPPLPSYDNAGGKGNRTSSITVTGSWSPSAGAWTNLVNGGFSNDSTNSLWTSGTNTDRTIIFDFGERKLITEATFYQSNTSSHGSWRWQGSDDGSSWTDIGSPFTLGGVAAQVQTELSGNTGFYRYYRMLGVSGSWSSSPWVQEIEFKIVNEVGL